jgi:hypothetical protein
MVLADAMRVMQAANGRDVGPVFGERRERLRESVLLSSRGDLVVNIHAVGQVEEGVRLLRVCLGGKRAAPCSQ